MSIDWFTVIAQAFNFLLLLWLMKRFLYKPILKAIDEREKRIAEKLSHADMKSNEALKQKEEYEIKNEEFSRQSSSLLAMAQDEGNSEKNKLLQEARAEADLLRKRRNEELAADEIHLRDDVNIKIVNEVLAVTRKFVKDLAERNLNDQMVLVFTDRLHNLEESEKERLMADFKTKEDSVTIRTAFDISQPQKKNIEDVIKNILGLHVKILYVTTPLLIGGIEMSVNGQKITWSVSDYLYSLETGIK